MTQPYELIDETAVEREDRELTAALFEEFAAERPAADDFAAGVRNKIDQPKARVKFVPGYLRAAAAMLPPFLLPKSLTAGVGGAVAGKGLAKLVPGIAVFPIASLAVLAVTLVALVRVLLRPVAPAASGGVDSKEVDRQLREWWHRHLFAVVAVATGLVLLFIYAQVEAAALVLVISTVALLVIWLRLSALGFVTRVEVGRQAAGVLSIVAANSLGIVFHLRGEQAGVVLVPPLLFGAMFVCLWLSGVAKWRVVLVGVLGLIVVPVFLIFDSCFGITGKIPGTLEEVRLAIENPKVGLNDWRLETVARCVRQLRGAGVPVPDLEPLREHVQTERRASLAGQRFDHDSLAVIEFGFEMPEDYAYWQNDYLQKNVLAGDPVEGEREQRAALVLKAAGLLDAEACRVIARQIVDRDGPVHGVDRFVELIEEIRFVEALGHGDMVVGFADRARRLLRDRWLLATKGQQGLFSTFRESETDAPNRRVELATFVWLDSTSRAVELLARFGVPDLIDLVALGRYLDAERERYREHAINSYQADALCALIRLEALPEYHQAVANIPPPGVVANLLEWRVFVAALLLAGFAVGATWRAPRAEPGESRVPAEQR